MNNRKQHNWLLILAVVGIAIAPLMFVKGEYGGSDGEAQTAISELHPQYKPWFNSLIELPSKEVESMLFAVQAGLGAGVVGYVIGFYKGRNQQQQNETRK